jgi:hypothetical protein
MGEDSARVRRAAVLPAVLRVDLTSRSNCARRMASGRDIFLNDGPERGVYI